MTSDAGTSNKPVYGVGAVLYTDFTGGLFEDDQVTRHVRKLKHVTDTLVSEETGERWLVLWDGTHTTRQFIREEDAVEEYIPAGWQWPPGEKPLYFLTRECGLMDAGDSFTYGSNA